MNPGKIVRARAMNDRTLFRFKPTTGPRDADRARLVGLSGRRRRFPGAVEMCNNNGECRKHAAGVMCPSFRVTGNERDVTRGRANSLRLAISGQLGPDAFASDEMLETMKLCVSCKGCRRECPTGVDMAKMKIEVLAAANRRRGLSLHDRLIAYLPHYAPYAARLGALHERLATPSPAFATLTERLTGFSAKRPAAARGAGMFFSPSPRSGEGRGEGAARAGASFCPSP
jgi:Fe-S oxidoreductase